MLPPAQPPQQYQKDRRHQNGADQPFIHGQGKVHVVDGMVLIAVCGYTAQKRERRLPEYIVPDLKPPRKQPVDPSEDGGTVRDHGVEEIPRSHAEHSQQRIHCQQQSVIKAAFKDTGQQFLQQKQQKQQEHGAACPAADGHKQGVQQQGGQSGPVIPAQAGPAQPGPGKENTNQTGSVSIIMPVTIVPIPAVIFEGDKGSSVMQQLYHKKAGGGYGQKDPHRFPQVHILCAQPGQGGQHKPVVVAIEGGKTGVNDDGGQQYPLPSAFIPGEQDTFGKKQKGTASGQGNAEQSAQRGQGGLDVGTEHFAQNQQHGQPGTVDPLGEQTAALL